MRRELEARPLVLLLFGLILGLTAVQHPFNLLFLLPILFVGRTIRSCLAVAVGLLTGLVVAPFPVSPVSEPSFVQGTARILDVPRELKDAVTCDALVRDVKVRLLLPLATEPHEGETWQVSGVVKPASEGADKAYEERGLQGILTVSRAQRISRGPSVFVLADSWRTGFERFTHSLCDRDEAEWIDALCFRSGNLSLEEKQDLQTAGTFYLVAASGLHVYVLAGLILGGSALLRLPRPVQICGVIAVLLLYCLATGLHVTTLRASIACAVFLGAYLLRREGDSLSALGLTGVMYLLLFPTAVYSLGFQLSMIVVAALALFVPRRHSLEDTAGSRIRRTVLDAGWAATIVLLAGQPLISLYSGRMSIAEIPANLLTGAVAPVAIGLCFLAYAVNPISHAVGAGLLAFALPLVSFLRSVGQSFGGGGLSFDLPAFSGYWLAPYYGLWLLVWRQRVTPA